MVELKCNLFLTTAHFLSLNILDVVLGIKYVLMNNAFCYYLNFKQLPNFLGIVIVP